MNEMNEMKEQYTSPTIGIILFEDKDVITASNDLPFVPFSDNF